MAVIPKPCKRKQKAAPANAGWDYPSPTFIYAGFDCGLGEMRDPQGFHREAVLPSELTKSAERQATSVAGP